MRRKIYNVEYEWKGTVRDCDIWIGTDNLTKDNINGLMQTKAIYRSKILRAINKKGVDVIRVRCLKTLMPIVEELKRDFDRFVICREPKDIFVLSEDKTTTLSIYEYHFEVKTSTY